MQFLMSHFEGALLNDTRKREEKIEWNNKIGITKIHWEMLTCFRILLLVKQYIFKRGSTVVTFSSCVGQNEPYCHTSLKQRKGANTTQKPAYEEKVKGAQKGGYLPNMCGPK